MGFAEFRRHGQFIIRGVKTPMPITPSGSAAHAEKPGITGTNTKHREGFKRMVADALSGKIEIKAAELIQFDFSGAAKF